MSREPHRITNLRLVPRDFINQLLFNPLSGLEEFTIPIHRLFIRYMNEREDEEYQEEISENPNFMQEKNMNFRLYPFYINWKKIEHNEEGYYRVFFRYGYLGAATFSNFKEKYPSLDFKNILFILAEFVSEHLCKKNENNNNNSNEDTGKKIKEFFEKLPNLKGIFELIEKKIIMMKEVPLFILILKIYEINCIINNDNEEIIDILKYEYLLLSYLTDEEYKKIYINHFKGKVSKIFKKLSDTNGKNYLLPKTKMKYINHIKSVYKSNNKANN